MRVLSIRLLGLLICTVLAFAPRVALAGSGGLQKGIRATHIFSRAITLQANRSYTIETLNLSSGADTVLHVQTRSAGDYLDGNDDCSTRLAGCSGFRSYVSIPASNVLRNVWVIVRSYGSQSGGTATLRITPSGLAAQDSNIDFRLGYKKSFTAFRASSHFFSVEERGGSRDTVLLVTSGATSRAIAFDDDDGVQNMSWVHVNEACSSNCAVFVGALSNSTAGTTSFMWDEDIHTPGASCDADGMSDALEMALGTQPCDDDTDDDGISDGVEVMGVDASPFLLKMPMYGADPLYPDLFLEADWRACVPANMDDWTCGDPSAYDVDKYQLPADRAMTVASTYYGPDVRLHFDIGRSNDDPATWRTWGDWGGATRYFNPSDDKCDQLSPSRFGYFHGVRINSNGGGGQANLGGSCLDAGWHAGSFAHELGHNLNLYHAPTQSGGLAMNCAPNYRSIMSYASNDSWRFSRNQFGAVPLNGVAMNESLGLGTSDPLLLDHLGGPDFRYHVYPNGAVDWNRDGRINPGLVRAAASWGWGGGGGCEMTMYQRDMGILRESNSAALSWFSSCTVQNGCTPKLYWFTKREADNRMEYRTADSFPDNCGTPPSPSCKTNWAPALDLPATLVDSSIATGGAPAVAATGDGENSKLVLVYKNATNQLVYQTLTWHFLPLPPRYVGFWTSPVPVGTGGEVVDGDPAAVRMGSEVQVFAASGGRLKRWRLGPSGFGEAEDQRWTDDSFIQPSAQSIAATVGYLKSGGVSQPHVVALVPTGLDGYIYFAWQDVATGKWARDLRSSFQYMGWQAGIAYEPFDLNDPSEGRYYVAYVPGPASTRRAIAIQFSEGNDLDATESDGRRMYFALAPAYYQNVWAYARGNVALHFDLAHDRNLRGAWTFDFEWRDANGNIVQAFREPNFTPIADGIINGVLKDQDDYGVIKSNLACSLGHGPCL